MPPLPTDQCRRLENAVVRARDAAEAAARAALQTLAVEETAPFPSMSEGDRKLRRDLRARARQLGDGTFDHGIPLLIDEIAYEQWHRVLFARFLAENGLLRHPTLPGVTVSLLDCAELAAEDGTGDGLYLAARYAELMLPGLFRADDPAVRVRFAPEGRANLERILSELPASTFTADDALGWVYQFWQSKRKDEVNRSGRKIGGADLSPVTQLFTEDYMVRFLLENSLGAWWAGKHPHSPLLLEWPYLRFGPLTPNPGGTDVDGTLIPDAGGMGADSPQDWGDWGDGGAVRLPAAGTFPGWPERAAEVTVMDPCCGSGHFLVAAFEMLRRMRMEEDGLDAAEAADAVLRDNLFGLELDPRCTQIAAFAVAVAAWKVGGHPERHPPRIACSGTPVRGQLEEWLKLAKDDTNLRNTLRQLHELFVNAPTLGSLIDPRRVVDQQYIAAPKWSEVEAALQRLTRTGAEDAIFAHAAEETARAAMLLSRRYTLVATNVPYLQRTNQSKPLREFCVASHDDAKEDLATVFWQRCLNFCIEEGAVAAVVQQNWTFLGRYKDFRRRLIETTTWSYLVRLGANSFEEISGEIVNVALQLVTNQAPGLRHEFRGLDVSSMPSIRRKDESLRERLGIPLVQVDQIHNADSRIIFEHVSTTARLSSLANSLGGITTGDSPRWRRAFWELFPMSNQWRVQQTAPRNSDFYCGREHVLWWSEAGGQSIAEVMGGRATIAGRQAWGKVGVTIQYTSGLNATLYNGDIFENVCAVVVPKDPKHLAAVWEFCQSEKFRVEVRKLDKKLGVTCNTLAKVPFDLEHWQKVADEKYPDGLPTPYSNNPNQWLFNGHPADSSKALHVAVARLLGYHWPQQGEDDLDQYADQDGIVCLPALSGEQPAIERLRRLLAAAYGDAWSLDHLHRLLLDVGAGDKDLATWLRDDFFREHASLFLNRPFLWHIWDGRKDGFSAIVNYHMLDAARLDKLIYTYLGAWIARQKAEQDAGTSGAEGRFVSATELQSKLKAIRQGEKPFDVYVRWKLLHEQPIGWEPDLSDGVRLNIRPFALADVLRSKVRVSWGLDSGTNPDGSQRLNDLHLTRAEKQAARDVALASSSPVEA